MTEFSGKIKKRGMIMARKKFRFDFALSFAGTQRDIARELRNALVKRRFKVFFDEDFEDEMLGKDGIEYLRKVYSEESRYCVVLISKEYDKRIWTKLEREIMQARQLSSGDDILLPVLIGDYKPRWLLASRIYFDLRNRSITDLVELLKNKVK
jgi:hypothetical protein